MTAVTCNLPLWILQRGGLTPCTLACLFAGCLYSLYDDARPEFALAFPGIYRCMTSASASFMYSEVYCPWGACLPNCSVCDF